SRRRHTRSKRDWSSDVCSSDLLLGEETEILKIENEIQDELKTQMDKNQREYYLREQIKVIQSELGEQDTAAEAETYRKRVLDLQDRKSVVYGKSVDRGGRRGAD